MAQENVQGWTVFVPPLLLESSAMLEQGVHFWAKTTADGKPGISVRDHCLNVGRVAEGILDALPFSLRDFCPPGAVLLIAAHDIGKISTGFAVKCPVWLASHALAQRASQCGWGKSESNHAAVSQDFVWAKLPSGRAKLWAVAVGGHHGRFLGKKFPAARRELDQAFTGDERERLIHELVDVFGPPPDAPPESDSQFLFVAGWMTVADWIGSNEAFFPLLETYDLEISRSKAALALEAIRWNRGRLREGLDFQHQFTAGGASGFTPNPLQQTCLAQITSPGLHVIEAPMGRGKTEAALAAAYRLISDGHHHGLYFALPTQLTSNRIHERVETFLRNTLDEETDHPLAHCNSWLHRGLQIHLRPAHAAGDDGERPTEHAREARSWFASSKQALLARHGVGTIDQALLGVVAAKYCAVRLFGLAGKVVILDEVHSYDAYMSRLIDRLITRLLELKCTVLVLSATLTSARRTGLLQAAGAKVTPEESAYPLVSSVNGSGEVTAAKPDFTETAPLDVRIRFHDTVNPGVWVDALEAAEEGGCVLVIRNTVDAAQETFHQLQSLRREGGPEIALLHSRFPQFAREERESKWMRRLGKHASRRPDGCVLVATQVVEQSVDIDADLLVTDLAPTDVLLQRMGRLWRHERGKRPLDHPMVRILSGSFEAMTDPKQLRDALGKSAFVYPPYVLLRTWEIWRVRNAVSLPGDIRDLLEATYAKRADDAEPEGWPHWRTELDQRVQRMENTASGRTNIFDNVALEDQEGVQTRWNDFPSGNLLLLDVQPVSVAGGEMKLAFINGLNETASAYEWRFPVAAAIHLNLVRVPLYAVRDALDGDAAPDWLRLHSSGPTVFGVVNPDDGTISVAGNDSRINLEYRAETGVRIRRAQPPSTPATQWKDDDESWF